MNLLKAAKTFLWGNSVALAWTWGLGTFLSVQIAVQYGFDKLVKFAVIDAFGLGLFGLLVGLVAKKFADSKKFENFVLDKTKNFSLAIYLFQFLAVTLTLHAVLKYIALPLGVLSILVAAVLIGATIFLGEEFSIKKIKYSHAIYGTIVLICVTSLINSTLFSSSAPISASLVTGSDVVKAQLEFNTGIFGFLNQVNLIEPLYQFKGGFSEFSFYIYLLVGFLCGPWLDIQHWQRTVQMKKEELSIGTAYAIGAVIFCAILLVQGTVALACYKHILEFNPELLKTLSNLDPSSLLFSVKAIIPTVFNLAPEYKALLGVYIVMVACFALSTFDSSYVAYRWYSESQLKDSKNIIFSFIPVKLVSSPIPWLFASMVVALVTLHFAELGKFVAIFDPKIIDFFRFELEYYTAFYGSFFVVYAVTLYRNFNDLEHTKSFTALKLFSTALTSIAIFGIGYFSENQMVMAIGALLPFLYGWFTVTKESDYQVEDQQANSQAEKPVLPAGAQIVDLENFKASVGDAIELANLPAGAKQVGIKGCYYNAPWFVHQFIPTYQDTNSVGNVYFAMYALWVGKVRELFFMLTMPDFDPKTSEFLILTRSFEHKFLKEINEFTEVTVQIRIADFNRKFVTLEHRIMDMNDELVGKGSQQLMFVDSSSYALVDLPLTVSLAFKDYIEDRAKVEKMIEKAKA